MDQSSFLILSTPWDSLMDARRLGNRLGLVRGTREREFWFLVWSIPEGSQGLFKSCLVVDPEKNVRVRGRGS